MKSRRSLPTTTPEPQPGTASAIAPQPNQIRMQQHLRLGWWALLIFLTAGLGLELLHGLKVAAYLKVSNETRRLMWTLAHAHGTLLGLVNIAFASTLRFLPGWPERSQVFASRCLCAATVLMPAGFFLGGLIIYAGDPGIGIVLVPVGGILLFIAALLTGLALTRSS
jgi:hypothetical protein